MKRVANVIRVTTLKKGMGHKGHVIMYYGWGWVTSVIRMAVVLRDESKYYDWLVVLVNVCGIHVKGFSHLHNTKWGKN